MRNPNFVWLCAALIFVVSCTEVEEPRTETPPVTEKPQPKPEDPKTPDPEPPKTVEQLLDALKGADGNLGYGALSILDSIQDVMGEQKLFKSLHLKTAKGGYAVEIAGLEPFTAGWGDGVKLHYKTSSSQEQSITFVEDPNGQDFAILNFPDLVDGKTYSMKVFMQNGGFAGLGDGDVVFDFFKEATPRNFGDCDELQGFLESHVKFDFECKGAKTARIQKVVGSHATAGNHIWDFKTMYGNENMTSFFIREDNKMVMYFHLTKANVQVREIGLGDCSGFKQKIVLWNGDYAEMAFAGRPTFSTPHEGFFYFINEIHLW
jgi:hypothetical protein